MSLYQYVPTELTLMNLQDYIEIICIAASMFYALRWLHKDQYKNLTRYVYIFFAMLFFAYTFDFYAITLLLLTTSPIIGILLVIFHQEQFQKNFVSHKSITPSHTSSNTWINDLIKSVLHTVNHGNNCMLIIEKRDPVDAFFETFSRIHADITHDLLYLLLARSQEHSILVLTSSGKITSYNPTFWKQDDETQNAQATNIQQWEKQALLIAAKTQAFCCIADASSHTLKAITHNHIIAPLSTTQLQTMIQKHCSLTKQTKTEKLSTKQKGAKHASFTSHEKSN